MAKKSVPKALKLAVEESRKAFFPKFGRLPGPNDPVIFDPDANEPTPIDPIKMRQEMGSVMKDAGIPGMLIYAYEKTGILLSEVNEHLFSQSDLDEYDAAIAEYRNLN